ncbi:MAG TPA: flagellar motor protein MotB, partial [Planctomycetota bacterium]|nr:flagellar motor protein MotB [Planctomycetota bacterium]
MVDEPQQPLPAGTGIAPRSRRERPPEEEAPGAPEWIVTFTDMVSLLVTFFVLLMTFSSMNELEVLQVRGVLHGKTGVLSSGTGPRSVDPPRDDLRSDADPLEGALVPHSRPEEEYEREREDPGRRDQGLQFDLTEVEDGLLLTFGPAACFAPGSAELAPELAEALDALGLVLSHYPHQVVLEGHASKDFRASLAFPDPHAVSVARAVAA